MKLKNIKNTQVFVILCFVFSALLCYFLRTSNRFNDEYTLLTFVKLINNGQKIYKDFFTHHMPISYFLVSIFYFLGFQTKTALRLIFGFTQIATLVFYYFYFKNKINQKTIPVVSIAIFLFIPYAWNNMVLADSMYACAALGLFLFVYKNEEMNFSIKDQVIISILTFVAAMSTQIAWYPLLLFYGFYAYVRIKKYISDKKFKKDFFFDLRFAFIVLIPYIFLFLSFVAVGIFTDFWNQAIIFNLKYYADFTGNESPLGLFTDNFRSIIIRCNDLIENILLILNGNIDGQIVFEVFIFGSFLICACSAIKQRKNAFSFFICSFVYLLFMRDGFHGCAFYYVVVAWIIDIFFYIKWNKILIIAISSIIVVFSNNLLHYFENGSTQRETGYSDPVNIIQAVTKPDDVIWGFPYRTSLYIEADRFPAFGDIYYLPWQAAVPGYEEKILDELKNTEPWVIVVDKNESVWDFYKVEEYASSVLEYVYKNYFQINGLNDIVYFNESRRSEIEERLKQNENYKEYLSLTGKGQLDSTSVVGNIGQGTVKQEFIAESNNLYSIAVMIGTYQQNFKEGNLVLEILDNSKMIRRQTLEMSKVEDNSIVKFKFPPIEDSEKKLYTFRIYIEGNNHENSYTLYSSEKDVLLENSTFLNDKKIEQDVWFIDYYEE